MFLKWGSRSVASDMMLIDFSVWSLSLNCLLQWSAIEVHTGVVAILTSSCCEWFNIERSVITFGPDTLFSVESSTVASLNGASCFQESVDTVIQPCWFSTISGGCNSWATAVREQQSPINTFYAYVSGKERGNRTLPVLHLLPQPQLSQWAIFVRVKMINPESLLRNTSFETMHLGHFHRRP